MGFLPPNELRIQPPAKQARSASEAGRLDARVSTLP